MPFAILITEENLPKIEAQIPELQTMDVNAFFGPFLRNTKNWYVVTGAYFRHSQIPEWGIMPESTMYQYYDFELGKSSTDWAQIVRTHG